MNLKPRYQHIASTIGARDRCESANSVQWCETWGAVLTALCEDLPSGAGFDAGSQLDNRSTARRLVFTTSFHHMDDHGSYDGWTEHVVNVGASLESGCEITSISGRDRNDVKDYISEIFDAFLHQQIDIDQLITAARGRAGTPGDGWITKQTLDN